MKFRAVATKNGVDPIESADGDKSPAIKTNC